MQFYKFVLTDQTKDINNMSELDLRAYLTELKLLQTQNTKYIEEYKASLEIRRLVNKLINQVAGKIAKKSPQTYEDWVLEQEGEEYKQTKDELRFMSKLYARYSSTGNIDMASKVKDTMDTLKRKLGN